jgi:hypothetical protein
MDRDEIEDNLRAVGNLLAERGLTGELGDFLDDWRRTAPRDRAPMIADPLEATIPGTDEYRWAAFLAATVDMLAADEGIATPAWANDAYRLASPWFLNPGTALRADDLIRTPVPFKMRNIFGGPDLIRRV